MIQIKCEASSMAKVTDMVPFQGQLKTRTEKDIAGLAETLLKDGLLMPFALWQDGDVLRILDGHGRYEAIAHIALQDPSVLLQEYPCIKVQASSEEEARKALLQIVSVYGKISREGVIKFAAPVIDYKAPVLVRASHPVRRSTPVEGRVVVRIAVDKAKVAQLTSLLREVEGIEVL